LRAGGDNRQASHSLLSVRFGGKQVTQQPTEPRDTETGVLLTLCGAVDDLEAAIEQTQNGLLADHCENALREVRKAMRMVVGGEGD